MRRLLPTPRLLPITMAAMIALMGVKSVALVRAAVPTKAEAAQPAPAPGKPAEHAQAANAASPKAEPPKPHGPGEAAASSASSASAASASGAPASASPGSPSAASTPPDATLPAAPTGPPPVSETERGLLLELRERRTQLEARDTELQAREQVLAAAEHRLAARLDELTALRGRLEALETARKEHDDANWRSMVKLYEAMKPRDAAVIFNDLDMAVLLQVVDRMKETRAAPVLAAMQPERARQLTAELAQMRAKANTTASAAPPAPRGG